MTRADLYDWCVHVHKCDIELLSPNTTSGMAIKLIGPKGGIAYLDLPPDSRKVKPYLACDTCMKLGIEIPTFCEDQQELAKTIKKNHYPNK